MSASKLAIGCAHGLFSIADDVSPVCVASQGYTVPCNRIAPSIADSSLSVSQQQGAIEVAKLHGMPGAVADVHKTVHTSMGVELFGFCAYSNVGDDQLPLKNGN